MELKPFKYWLFCLKEVFARSMEPNGVTRVAYRGFCRKARAQLSLGLKRKEVWLCLEWSLNEDGMRRRGVEMEKIEACWISWSIFLLSLPDVHRHRRTDIDWELRKTRKHQPAPDTVLQSRYVLHPAANAAMVHGVEKPCSCSIQSYP